MGCGKTGRRPLVELPPQVPQPKNHHLGQRDKPFSRNIELDGFEDIAVPTQCLIIPDGDRRFRIVLNPTAELA